MEIIMFFFFSKCTRGTPLSFWIVENEKKKQYENEMRERDRGDHRSA